jgi:hypothetical protein
VGEGHRAAVIEEATAGFEPGPATRKAAPQGQAFQREGARGRHMHEPKRGRTSRPFDDRGGGPGALQGEGTPNRREAIRPVSVVIDGGQGIGAGLQGDRIGPTIGIGLTNRLDQAGHIP